MNHPTNQPLKNDAFSNMDAQNTGAENNSQEELSESEKRYEQGTEQDVFAVKDSESAIDAKHSGNDTANNDGSVLETLDTAFHGEPGYNSSSSDSGSNRADFYEERSYEKSDDDEELEARKQN